MKCVCPMGGDRTCPDDCPLAVWQSLSSDDRKAKRKPIAERLYNQGFTMEAIAMQLGVSHQTIGRDLDNLSTMDKSKPAKTIGNPKGAGRPKGSKQRRKNESISAATAAQQILDLGKTYQNVEKESGLSNTVLRSAVAREEGRREAEAAVDPTSLSLTAQQKLAAAIHQEQRRLAIQFEQRVLDEAKQRIDQIVLPHWKEQIEQAKTLYERRHALMDKATFNKIRRALHPDSRRAISDKMLAEAFDTFMSLEKYLLNEKDSPTPFHDVPDNLAEWDKMRAKAAAERRAARGNSHPLRYR